MFNNKKQQKGFTLIELMVVILIVGILAAVAIPIMHGRINAAKWSEGKAMAGTIRSSIRAYFAEKGVDYGTATFSGDLTGDFAQFSGPLGFASGDLSGKYFADADFRISDVSVVGGSILYTITIDPVTQADRPTTPGSMTLTQDGTFTDGP
jgi:prepilin-type N-terminal cleavage/methylation domain-containing protein